MGMYHGSHVRTFLIYTHMHLNFGRRTEALVRLDYISLCIHLADEIRGHKAFGNTCGGAKEFIVIELYGNVAVIGRHHVTVVDSLSDVTHQFLKFILVLHYFLHSAAFPRRKNMSASLCVF